LFHWTIKNLMEGTFTSQIQFCARKIDSDKESDQLEALAEIRKILSGLKKIYFISVENSPPIDEVIDFGLIPSFVKFLSHKNEGIQFEAAWCLTNVAAGTPEHTKIVMDSGAVSLLVNLITTTKNEQVLSQSIWALSNISGDSIKYRDILISAGLLDNLAVLLSSTNNTELVS
jgi:importin subunit alpha-6/7